MDTPETIYLSGPISYNVAQAKAEFTLAHLALQKKGYKVINPFDVTEGLDLHPERDYDKILRLDVAEMLLKADKVATLKGWEESPGANKEIKIARLMNIEVVPILKLLPEYAPTPH